MQKPCSICHDRPRGRAATVYWRWQSSPEDWERYRQRLCAACFVTALLPIYQASRLAEWGRCVQVHEKKHATGDALTVWATMYTPKSDDPVNWEISFCQLHAQDALAAMTRGADDLNTLEGSGGGAPPPDPWAGVELPEST